MIKLLLIFISITIASPIAISHEKFKEPVIWGTEYWPGLVNRNNSGLYDELINEVFSQKGIELIKIHMPFERALLSIQDNKIDIAGGIRKENMDNRVYYYSSMPVLNVETIAYYNKNTFQSPVISVQDIKNHIICGTHQYLNKTEIKNVYPVRTKMRALMMTLTGRCDVLLTNGKTIKILLEEYQNVKPLNWNIDLGDFTMTILEKKSLYMVFPRTKRGLRIMELYDDGINSLRSNGKIKYLYQKHSLEVPNIND